MVRGETIGAGSSDARSDRPLRAVRRARFVDRKVERRPDGVAIVTLDRAGSHNTITPAFGGELGAALDAALCGSERARGRPPQREEGFVHHRCRHRLRPFDPLSRRTPRTRHASSRDGSRATAARANRWSPTSTGPRSVAVSSSRSLCTAAIASDDPRTVFGLPEVKLGLLPAANGLLRVADRAGLVWRSIWERRARASARSTRRFGPSTTLFPPPPVSGALPARASSCDGARARRQASRRSAPTERARARHACALREESDRTLCAFPEGARRDDDRNARSLSGGRAHHRLSWLGMASRGFRSAADPEPRVFGDLVVSETAHRLMDLFFARAPR